MERMRILHYTCFAHPPQEGDIGDGGHIGGKASRLQGRAAGAFSLLVCRSLWYNKNKCYKEEPNMPVSRENVLYFDPNSGEQAAVLKSILVRMGVRIRNVAPEAAGQTIGCLLGRKGFDARYLFHLQLL